MRPIILLSIMLISTLANGEQLVEVNGVKNSRVIKTVTLNSQDFSTVASQISFNNVVYDISSPKLSRVTDQYNINFKFEVSIENTQHTNALLEKVRRENEENSNGRLRRIVGVSPVLHKVSLSLEIPVEQNYRALSCRDFLCQTNSYVLKEWYEKVPPELSSQYSAIHKMQTIELIKVQYENATGVFHSMTIAVMEYTDLYPIPTISPGISIGN